MDSKKKTTPKTENDEPSLEKQEIPADALSLTPEELEEEQTKQPNHEIHSHEETEKKLSPIKRFFRKVNVYFLIFFLLVIVAGAVAIVNYLNSQKGSSDSNIAAQNLTQESLKQLANTDASVGNTSQTLTIKGNAVIEGQALTRGSLNVAGNFQTGGTIQGSSITISGTANIGEAQINNLQVASNVAIQGSTTLRDLNVAGAASFGGDINAAQITVTRLILAGNGSLQVPNHISFAGPSPSRSINSSVLGSGGSASISGSDTSGTVNISTGSGTAAGCFVQINFSRPFGGQPHVIISPVDAGAGRTQYYTTRTTTSFSICAATPAPANQSFAFDYLVTG